VGWLLGLVKLATLRGSLRARAYSSPTCSSEDFSAPLVSAGFSQLLRLILQSHPPALCVCVSVFLSVSLSLSKKDLKSDRASPPPPSAPGLSLQLLMPRCFQPFTEGCIMSCCVFLSSEPTHSSHLTWSKNRSPFPNWGPQPSPSLA
jgi:hypothetical protein